VLDPASGDDVALAGDGGAIVGGEEEDEAGDLFGKDVALERLCGEDAVLVSGRHVEAVLAFGEDGSREDGVYADVEGAEVAGEGASHGDDGSFGHVVEGEVGSGDQGGDGAHVDDGALACGLHAGDDGLRGEELVGEVQGHTLVPVFGGDVFDAVAVVAGGVVDEDVWCAEGGDDVGEGGLEGGDVGEVAAAVEGWVGGVAEGFDEGNGGLVGYVEEDYAGVLEGELFDGGGAYALSAPGDENQLVGEAWVGGEDAGWVHRELGVAICR
jgi:hypothetical protein